MSSESKVGIFVFLGMILLFLLATQVGSFQNISKDGYRVYSDFDNVSGLDVNSKIKANGIDVGYIEDLKIAGDKVRVTMFMYEGMQIPSNSTVKPLQESLLGGKYVGLTLGNAQTNLKDQDIVKTAETLMDFNDASHAITEAAIEFKALTTEVREILNGEARESLRMTFSNLEKITTELERFTQLDNLNRTADNFNNMAVKLTEAGDSFKTVGDNINHKLPTILSNLDLLIKDLKVASAEIKNRIPGLADKFAKIEGDIETLISENRQPVNNALTSANSFFSSGTDTFDKVDELLNTINKVQLEVAMRNEYMMNDSANKGYVSLNYIPSDTKRFMFDIVSTEDYSRLDDDNNFIEPKKHEDSEFLLSAQIAKRYDDLVLRAGLIENSAGAGVDYYLLDDTFKASAQVHDFNAVNDVRGNSPHAKVSARYTLLKHLDLYGGYDNFLNEKADNAFVGIGVRFFDDDLKKLIMSQSLGSFAR
ncbi:MAG: MlaD family protein [Epsilonproteobacteria bacterium]|nr:MlaD family protein [Campylobacterota bacterium]